MVIKHKEKVYLTQTENNVIQKQNKSSDKIVENTINKTPSTTERTFTVIPLMARPQRIILKSAKFLDARPNDIGLSDSEQKIKRVLA